MATFLQQLDTWYRTELGYELFRLEADAARQCVDGYRGEYLLQLGSYSDVPLVKNTSMTRYIHYSSEQTSRLPGPSICGSFAELALQPNSLDMIIVHHVLEFIEQPEQLLSQLYDTLAPQGRLLLFTFNACSLWGLKRLCQRVQTPPWQGHFYTPWRLKKLLTHQQLSCKKQLTLFFRPPFATMQRLKWSLMLEVMGPILWGNHGAVNLLVAEKNRLFILPVDQRLTCKTTSYGAVPQPTTCVAPSSAH